MSTCSVMWALDDDAARGCHGVGRQIGFLFFVSRVSKHYISLSTGIRRQCERALRLFIVQFLPRCNARTCVWAERNEENQLIDPTCRLQHRCLGEHITVKF